MTASDARKERIQALLSELDRRSLVMGVVNVTPDSFSDGGKYLDSKAAVEHGLRLLEEGADLLDIGGESTRPGSESVEEQEQIERVVPVIEGIRARSPIPISVDTTRLPVAEAAFRAGADIANDVSALRDSPELAGFVAESEGLLVLMHMRGVPRTMQTDTTYQDVVGETRDFLAERAALALSAGLGKDHVWIDPGIGFGKSREGNLKLLRRLTEYDCLGFRLLVGLSRKSFIGATLGREVGDRLSGTLAATAYIASTGPNRVHRVHDVREAFDCLRMIHAIRFGG